ncbi:MAG: hypothetical protein KKB34_02825 [Bacteroidetes bacterium]|nr:hypothetical protein [Bacteroidota bacterium]
MSIIRIIFIGIVFYFFFKLFRAIFKLFENKQEKQNSFNSMNTNYKKNVRSRIDKKDIIEVDFEEIDKK